MKQSKDDAGRRTNKHFGRGEYYLPSVGCRTLQQVNAIPFFLKCVNDLAPEVPVTLIATVEPAYKKAIARLMNTMLDVTTTPQHLRWHEVQRRAEDNDQTFRELEDRLAAWARGFDLVADTMLNAALACLGRRATDPGHDLEWCWVGHHLNRAPDGSLVPSVSGGIQHWPEDVAYHEFTRFDGEECVYQDPAMVFEFETGWDPQTKTTATFRQEVKEQFLECLEAFISNAERHVEDDLGMKRLTNVREIDTNFARLVRRRILKLPYSKIELLDGARVQDSPTSSTSKNLSPKQKLKDGEERIEGGGGAGESAMRKGIREAERLLGLPSGSRKRER